MTDPSTAALLDQCIDALLAGEDWRQVIPSTHAGAPEVVQLMHIAEDLRAAGLDLAPEFDRARPAKDATRSRIASRGRRP